MSFYTEVIRRRAALCFAALCRVASCQGVQRHGSVRQGPLRSLPGHAAACLLAVLVLGPGVAGAQVAAEVTLAPHEALDASNAAALVRKALADKVDGLARIEIRRPALPLHNQSPVPVRVTVEGVVHDAAQHSFRATLRVAGGDGRGGRVDLSGLVVPQAELPVLNRPLDVGERIVDADLDLRVLDRAALPEGTLLRGQDLVGRETRRRLAPGRPVLASDLQASRAVRRGDTVSVVFERGGLRLTLLGRALDDAAIGEVTRVLNVDSGRPVSGLVTATREVKVGAATGSGS